MVLRLLSLREVRQSADELFAVSLPFTVELELQVHVLAATFSHLCNQLEVIIPKGALRANRLLTLHFLDVILTRIRGVVVLRQAVFPRIATYLLICVTGDGILLAATLLGTGSEHV